jgi:hypothetical protein
MDQNIDIDYIIENTRQEILFAIKERIAELTRETGVPVRLNKVLIRDKIYSHSGSLRFFEIKNVYVDEADKLCGDLVGKDDRYDDGVLFGKNIEELALDDLKLLLDALFGKNWSIDCSDYDMSMSGRRDRQYGFFNFSSKTAALWRLSRRARTARLG